MTALLEVQDLVKDYRGLRAVDGVSFRIEAGRCFGLLGPNGAGKTTTVEMLEGITPPTAGIILYRGAAPDLRFRNEMGIMFQATALQERQTVRETLRLFADLYPRNRSLDELAAQCALTEFLDRDTRRLSGGQRQRLLRAVALVNDPDILFLDEPTPGLDPPARRRFWELVEGIKARGKTVVLTTHYMDEAYVLSDEIAIMDHGRIIAQGTPQALLAEHFDEVILQLPATALERAQLELPLLRRDEVVEIATQAIETTLAELLAAGVPLAGLRTRTPTLEDLFLELTGRELRA
ncbi:MAG: ABC transporter ATP-binding protein [Candidatus Competibacterales bacterium]|nr:ABC transporter ATP-binding protein [Candidatus Competibacterales bacterium]